MDRRCFSNVARASAAILLASGLFVSTVARAQSTPELQDLVVQGEVLNRDAALATEGLRMEEVRTTEAIDGEGGLYILRLNKIFQVTASAGIGYTDNPTRTATDTGGSGFVDGVVSAGMSTRIHETVDVGANLNIGGREFFSEKGASSRSVSANAFVGTRLIGPVYANVVAFGGFSFDHAFNGGSSFHGISGNVSASLPVTQKIVVRPGAGVTRQWSEVSENDSTSINASVDALAVISENVVLTGRLAASIRWYDNFYEDVTFVARRDNIYSASAALSWQPTSRVTLALSATYEKHDSTFFVSDFDAFETMGALALRWRF